MPTISLTSKAKAIVFIIQGRPKRRSAKRKSGRIGMTTFNQHIGNIFSVYARSDREDRDWGMWAYENYHKRIIDIGGSFGVLPSTACGIFAALSPNIDEASNFLGLDRILSGADDDNCPGYT